MFLVYMPDFARSCSMERLAEARTFFAQPEHVAPGMEAEMAKTADAVTDCASLRAREGPVVASYLTQLVGTR
jgi:hypothetical protein